MNRGAWKASVGVFTCEMEGVHEREFVSFDPTEGGCCAVAI